ncbi:DNA polymerase-3 subunit gamma/tau [Aureimonas jatrophae]|uniref:DNA polymerase III subunit gamma/tau n=2 Tax=Aureimonas jatrophae TaxID=1166073 RepID=A0A1H0LVP9_9HYPH|nr:DNA polymerase III subunit gamma/tau [Aureimonas jatrophae]MBB3952769.1 DNA polymerase-3 subunit gamma/tau [Aureimonas jatrophae]SDO72247.1 DNA polymerase-3 subunit gamma/tau [Aureimonas jatrophae]
MADPTDTAAQPGTPYRVLARKYRPRSFRDLVGQEPMVRTLTNAFEANRIAQAWMLTGVRGVGKTTTARILARALNYQTDTVDRPTIDMLDTGVHDQAIMEGRHVDVVEMDAASHTGIDDIREIIAQVRYRPVSARYKVYIIDEVHMLSTQAFNGLLKTLEEPPEHVKFVFATTEIRKVPITVLSRCQRFDLRRVDPAAMIGHLRNVLGQEGIEAEDDALRILARASEGSVRDALSLTDQAIAHGAGHVGTQTVRDMLGLADRARVVQLFELVMRGDGSGALREFAEQYQAGADPVVVLQDLADFAHLVTSLRFVPETAGDASLSPDEVERGRDFAARLSVKALSEVWQMLLRAIGEAREAASPRQAAEMALIRISYAATLPGPDELVRLLQGAAPGGVAPNPGSVPASAPAPAAAQPARSAEASRPFDLAAAGPRPEPPRPAPVPVTPAATRPAPVVAAPPAARPDPAPVPSEPRPSPVAEIVPPPAPKPAPPARLEPVRPETARQAPASVGLAERMQAAPSAALAQRPVPQLAEDALPRTLEAVEALILERRDSHLRARLRRYMRPVHVEAGVIRFEPAPGAPPTLAGDLQKRLLEWTGRRWVVDTVETGGAPTLDEAAAERRARLIREAEGDPEVAALLAALPGAFVREVRLRGEPEPEEAAPEEAEALAPLAEEGGEHGLPELIDADPADRDYGEDSVLFDQDAQPDEDDD